MVALEKVKGPVLYGAEVALTIKVTGLYKLGANFQAGCAAESVPSRLCQRGRAPLR